MSSSSNSPNHRFSGTIDSFYDSEFTADISNRMRVPEKILISDNGFDDPAIIAAKKQTYEDKSVWMHVPERILVIGGESHASGREPLPELKLENSIHGDTNEVSLIQLTTPPHTLTLDEHSFPTVEEMNELNLNINGPNNKSLNRKKRNIALSGLSSNNTEDNIALGNTTKDDVQSPDFQSYYASNSSDINDESALLRRQIKSLSKRIAAIEIENQHRHQREVVIYTIGVIYFIVKGLVWIHKQL